MDQKKGPPIGIDLGTAYTRVAVFDGSNCSIIPDEYGNSSMPSYVAFTDSGVLVGEAARMQALDNPTNTIFDVIRLIGRCYSDPSVRHDMRLWPFKVIAGPDEQLLVEVHWKGRLWQFTPAEICSIIMMQVKVIAETHLSSTIVDAVITVPVHFNCKQRLEIKLAGTIAGLNFTKITSAPAASAFSYGMERLSRSSNIFPNIIAPLSTSEPDKHKLHKIVIFDLGAGTLDVAVVTIKDDVCKVLSTAGDVHLGGSDFDNNMIDHFVTCLKQSGQKDIINIPSAICKLRTFCEKAKIGLCSGNDMVPIKISPLYGDVNLDSSITETNFNELNGNLFQKSIDILFRCLIDAKMRVDDVDEVILVGGSTRIRLLHSKISSLFVGKEVIRSQNLETAHVYGAAIQAFFHSRRMKGRFSRLSLLDAAPFSLGLSSAYGNMIVCIPKNKTIPTNIKKRLHFQYPKNTPIPFEVYEGEGTLTSQNILLGKFDLSIPQFSPKGYFIDVYFQIRENGSLTVRAEEISNGTKNHITINCSNIKESKMRVSKALIYNISATISFSKNDTSGEWDRMRGKGVSMKGEGPRKIMNQSSTRYVESEEYAIGIDFGTTFSSVAVWQQNGVKIIKNEYDEPLTYSCVAFTDTGRLIGGAVHKKQVARDPKNTIHNIKRFVGRSRSDWSVQNDNKFLPFRIQYGDKGRSMVSVHYKNEMNCFALEEIAALILSKMKEIAEVYLNSKVTNAVMSIPACFSDSQRKAIKDAGTIAGLNVMQLLNEPTATAISYFLQKVNVQNSTLLIFDLGGGHLDVSVVDIDGYTIQVRASAGDTNLGGEDFDNNMVSYFVQNFMREHRKDISNKPRCLSRLKEACEKAKRILSQFMQTMIEIDALDDGIDIRTSITREVFEEINIDLFKRCIKCIEQCLGDAKLDKSSIDEVVLVGGSTRIPKIKQLLQDFFNGKELCNIMNVDETVAYGAAVRASILCGNKDIKKFCAFKVQDVTNFSLWLEGTGGAMNLLIPRGTIIPMKKEMLFSTCSNYQMRMSIGVCYLAINNEESRVVFTLSNIPSKPKGYSEIFVSFEIDDDGILNLSAKLVNAIEMNEIMISKDNCLTTAELHKMMETVVRFIAEDEENKARDVALNSLENFAYKMKNKSRDPGLPASSKKLVEEAAVDAISWLETHYNAGIDQISFWKKKLEIIESQIVYLGTDAS